MPIRTLPSRAIADASIQAVDIASNSISKAKIDVTDFRDQGKVTTIPRTDAVNLIKENQYN